MADSKITALTSISTSTDPANDPLVIVDVSDTSMAATGTTKKVTLNQLLGASGTATLASATITGDLTVDTSTLKVDSANNRVGIGTASPSYDLEIAGAVRSSLAIRGNFAGGTDIAHLRFINANGSIVGDIYAQNTNGGASDSAFLAFNTVSSGTSAERYRIASDGVATWSNVGGVAGTAMTLNATGLGVGGSPTEKLSVNGSLGLQNGGTQRWHISATSGSDLVFTRSTVADRFTITSDGNVGIGVTPSAWASGNKFIDINSSAAFGAFGSSDAMMIGNAYWNGSSWIRKTANNAWRFVIESVSSTPTMTWQLAANGSAGSSITWTDAMTLDASGNLLLGKTASGAYTNGTQLFPAGTVATGHPNGTGSGAAYSIFAYDGVRTGDITQNGTTGVLYNTASDYRLKEQVQPLSGGLARVNALKPSVYKWKSDGSNGEGFLAHELAEVVPFAVSGEKDAVNEDGSIKSQGIDMSRVVPILVAAIQELTAEVNALKNA